MYLASIKLWLTSFPSANLQHSWEMVGKKKGVSGQKESGQTEPSEESKENRERDRDFSRRRGGPPRRGRGASRGRECMDLPFNNPRNCHGAHRGTLCCIKAVSKASWADASEENHPCVCGNLFDVPWLRWFLGWYPQSISLSKRSYGSVWPCGLPHSHCASVLEVWSCILPKAGWILKWSLRCSVFQFGARRMD